jgi:FkbM family methyltransferase
MTLPDSLRPAIRTIKRIPPLYGALRRSYHFVFSAPSLQARITRALKSRQPVFFVQVGANDGVKADPIHELIRQNEHWRGIFIEPIRSVFHRLRQTYGDSERFIFENVAIGAEKGTRSFYYLSEEAGRDASLSLPFYYDQLGSFDRNHIFKHFDRRVEPFIIEEQIECVTLQEVLDRNHVAALDLLHVDVEGFDYQVLSQLDLSRYQPAAILFEHKHLPAEDMSKANARLETSGYKLFRYDVDTLAIRR